MSSRPVLHFYQVPSKYSKGVLSYRADTKSISNKTKASNSKSKKARIAMTRRLALFYISTKYHQNIPKGIQVTEWTRSFTLTPTPTGSVPKTICSPTLRYDLGHICPPLRSSPNGLFSKKVKQSQKSDIITSRSPSQTPRGRGNRQNQTSANRTNVRKALRLALSSPSEVIAMLKGLKKKSTRTIFFPEPQFY